ncbi:MAG: hypothetical protein KGM15_04520 [Pseudomonadota bacterium]|nr:hypothetical protein [Pseudomonadota bacterium]
MRIWVLLLGLAAVLAALIIAGGQAVITQGVAHANAALAGGLITIPLAANVEL